ncbi:Ger(x)C family spore germination protein [Lederbergia wuyishanensis]|uniref:Spore germination protein n=1 Tax=Lederbergia wuyishanensis TaxID=1347903 RepID=A0ABU0D994_9BACI|nr:Ger(x)C family spore germination protein [Lederbergia wuyishanensis]MCJ8009390.1 Ger(x)C family spore germination protein [Lederbergia wuyishanensis]MDQ0345001.1 spore germination protein [Lederbergia wuyishanensis]
MKKLFILFIFIPVLSGCVQTRVIDNITLVNAGGIDYVDGEDIRITALFTLYNEQKQAEDKNITMTMHHDAGIIDHLSREATAPVLIGGLDILVIDMKTAKTGIFPIIDTLQREPSVGSRLYLSISDTSANELLLGNYGSEGNAKFISNMIESNIKNRDIPRTNLHMFASDFFQKAKDAYLPILKKVEQDKIKIDGLGVFSKDKLVYKIPSDDMFYFKLLVDKHNKGSLDVKIKDKGATIQNIRSRSSIKTNMKTMTVDIHYNMTGIITKYTGKKLKREFIGELTKNTERKIERKLNQLLTDFQNHGVDPVGIQRKFIQQNRNFNHKRWEEEYKNITFNIHSKVTISESGTLE